MRIWLWILGDTYYWFQLHTKLPIKTWRLNVEYIRQFLFLRKASRKLCLRKWRFDTSYEALRGLKTQPWLSSSVKPWLVCSPVGEPTPDQQEPKLQWLTLPTNNNWGDGWLHRVIRQSHPLWPLVRGACGAAYSCVAPSGNPRLKKGGSGGSCTTVLRSNIFTKSAKLHSAGWLVCFDPSSWFPVQVTCYFWSDTLNQGFACEKAWVTCRAPVLTPSPHPVHPGSSAQAGGRLP